MSMPEEHHSGFAVSLGDRQSRRVIERAVRSKARLNLTPLSAHLPVRGCCQSSTPESIWLKLDGRGAEPPYGGGGEALVSVCCEAIIELDGEMYLFASSVLASADRNGCPCLELTRPACVQVLERRRFWRSNLRESSIVGFLRRAARNDAGKNAGDNAQAPVAEGAILNISLNGLACLMTREHADALYIGETMRARFCVPPREEPFELPVCVRSKSPNSDGRQIKVGAEILRDLAGDVCMELQAALNGTADRVTVGGRD